MSILIAQNSVQILLHLYTLRTPAEMDRDLDCPLTPQQVFLHLSSHLRTPLNINATTTSNLHSQLTFGTLSICEMRSHTHTKTCARTHTHTHTHTQSSFLFLSVLLV